MTSTDGPDDDPQQGPEHNVAQPRADSSAVARFNVADLDLASWRENVVREREKLHTTRQAAEETVPGVIEARHWGWRAGKLHPTEAKPAHSEVQSQVSKDAAFSRKTMQRKEKREGALKKRVRQQAKRKEKTEFRIQQKDCTAQFKSVGRAARVQCKREASRTRRTIAADRSVKDIAKQVTMTRERERVMSTREGKLRVTMTKTGERNPAIEKQEDR